MTTSADFTAFAERQILLETCQNFRDLGGYRTSDGRTLRWRTLFRADTLHRLSPEDMAVLVGLGLRNVVDLRATNELESHGRVQVASRGIAYHHLPMLDEVMGPTRAMPPIDPDAPRPAPGEGYIRMLGQGLPAVVEAVRLLAAPDGLPAVFHCTAGKDRTGILAAVILSALGVPDAQIVDDYVLTAHCREARDAFLAEHDPAYLGFLQSLPPGARDTLPETMQVFLDHVASEYGSARQMLLEGGVEPAAMDRLEASLLES